MNAGMLKGLLENVPDDFEHEALLQFEKQPDPIASIDRTGEEPVYRLMIPLENWIVR